MKRPLKKCTIAVTGDFGPNRTHDKLRQWIENNGGTFVSKVDSKVTHLISSRDHFRRSVEMVAQAREVKKLKIVSYDWLEDSLMKRSRKKEGEYLMRRKIKAIAKAKAEKKVVREKNLLAGVEAFKAGCNEVKNMMHKSAKESGYHIYHDYTGFSYDITLVRADLIINKNERYVLKLYESHMIPFTYACIITYSSMILPTEIHVSAPFGSPFETAMGSFKEFFELKSKKKWEDRLVDRLEDRSAYRSEDIENDKRAYLYFPPAPGEPVGIFFGDFVYDAVYDDPF